MAIVLTNAVLTDIDPPRVEYGSLRIEGGVIESRAARVATLPHDEIVDCAGAVVLPGLVNGHTHLYSTLAVGMPPPPRTPRNFQEILELVWWRLDQALDAETIELSALIGAMQALRCGTTTLIDHHASPNHIEGSLDLIERALSAAGVRGVLCYETTDRHGRAGREQGLEENRRYLRKCQQQHDGRFAALVGAHASFTLEDQSLDQIAGLADEFDSGVHIHVAEYHCDEEDARSNRRAALMDRLEQHGLARPNSIFAHGTHLSPSAIERVNAIGLTMAHNARSNMNNAVGYAPVAAFRCPVMLGTDGIGADMFAEAKAAWMISRHQHAGRTPNDIVTMLAHSARCASQALGVTVGKLEVGAAADVVITDYVPFTPVSNDNAAAHVLFGLSSTCVRDVLVAGRWRVRERKILDFDEVAIRNAAHEAAKALWKRMSSIPNDQSRDRKGAEAGR